MQLQLSASQLAYWDVAQNSFQVEAEAIKILVGSSSDEIKLHGRVQVTP